jgi:hypothetical protein
MQQHGQLPRHRDHRQTRSRFSCCPERARFAADGPSLVTDAGSSRRTINSTSGSGFAGASAVPAGRHSRYCPIGRRRQGTTASTADRKPGSCCASRTATGSDAFLLSRMRRDRRNHPPCGSGRHASCIWECC